MASEPNAVERMAELIWRTVTIGDGSDAPTEEDLRSEWADLLAVTSSQAHQGDKRLTGLFYDRDMLFRVASAILAALPEPPTEDTDAVGCAEREVGRFFYNRVSALMDAKPGTREGLELAYLAQAIGEVEEYGADGTETREPLDAPEPPSKSAESGEREGWVLMPREPGACELDDSGWLLAFMIALHSRVADTHPIMGWADFDDEQRDRIANAYRAMIAAAPKPPEKPRG